MFQHKRKNFKVEILAMKCPRYKKITTDIMNKHINFNCRFNTLTSINTLLLTFFF